MILTAWTSGRFGPTLALTWSAGGSFEGTCFCMKSGSLMLWTERLTGKGSEGGRVKSESLSWIGFVRLTLRADAGRGGTPLGMLIAGWMTARDDEVRHPLDRGFGELHALMTGDAAGVLPSHEGVSDESLEETADAEGDLESSRFQICPRIPAGVSDTERA